MSKLIIFYGVKIFESKKLIPNALLCVKTALDRYHVEIGQEPKINIIVKVTIENTTKKTQRNVDVRFFGLRSDYNMEILRLEHDQYLDLKKDEDGNFIHEGIIPLILKKRSIEIIEKYEVKLKVFELDDFEHISDNYYTKAMPLQQSDHPEIRKLAKVLKRDDTYSSVKNTIRWLLRNIHYDPVFDRLGAITTLRRKKGSCIEFSDLTVAILRAMNIPARVVVGYFIKEYHAWVEVLTNKGWIPLEPLAGLIGAIGIPWISIHAERRPREKMLKVKNCKGCKFKYDLILV